MSQDVPTVFEGSWLFSALLLGGPVNLISPLAHVTLLAALFPLKSLSIPPIFFAGHPANVTAIIH